MTLETLITLIKNIKIDKSDYEHVAENDIIKLKNQMIKEVIELFELYEKDNNTIRANTNNSKFLQYPSPFDKIGTMQSEELVPYHTICGCNPKNGGNGICYCTIANTMIKNQDQKTYLTQMNINSNNNLEND
jgi:hypothetical protein